MFILYSAISNAILSNQHEWTEANMSNASTILPCKPILKSKP